MFQTTNCCNSSKEWVNSLINIWKAWGWKDKDVLPAELFLLSLLSSQSSTTPSIRDECDGLMIRDDPLKVCVLSSVRSGLLCRNMSLAMSNFQMKWVWGVSLPTAFSNHFRSGSMFGVYSSFFYMPHREWYGARNPLSIFWHKSFSQNNNVIH